MHFWYIFVSMPEWCHEKTQETKPLGGWPESKFSTPAIPHKIVRNKPANWPKENKCVALGSTLCTFLRFAPIMAKLPSSNVAVRHTPTNQTSLIYAKFSLP